jgi:AraC-like DNA-binding protein
VTSFDPRRPDFEPYGFTCVEWQPSRMPRPDRHNEIEINLVRDGSLTYLLGGRKLQVQAGRLCMFWAAFPHQIVDFEVQADYFVATLPLAWFLQCKLPEPMVQSLLRGDVIGEPDEQKAAADVALLTRWSLDLRLSNEALTRAVLLEMEARLLRLTARARADNGHRRGSRHRAPGGAGPSKVEQMAILIARGYNQRLAIGDIARSVDLHPNYAMTLFKNTFGTTVVDYITKQRVSHAQRLLATTDMKILDAGLQSGFSSGSRFNAAFLAEVGCSPRAWRRQHRSAG